MTIRKKTLNAVIFLALLGGTLYLSFLLTRYVTQDETSITLIQEFGPIGILIISFFAGLNALVPIPAATFIPIFTAGGISLPFATLLLIIGTLCADLVAYAIGIYGSKVATVRYPNLHQKLIKLYTDKKTWVPYLIFGFAAFIPFPNEIYLIPLGIIGIKIRQFIIPLVLGTILYQTLAAFGIYNIFKYFLL